MKKNTVLIFMIAILIPGAFYSGYAGENTSLPEENNELERPGYTIPLDSERSIHVPGSSLVVPSEAGSRAHTNHLIFLKKGVTEATVPSGHSPADIRTAYGLPSSGGQGVIAIVDAYDYPTAENDLNVFSAQYGLPPCTVANGCFKKVYANGYKPKPSCGWSQEMALDIEWAHAIAPNAQIVLVEAASNSLNNLFRAVESATGISAVTEESNSWGTGEFPGETGYDPYFQLRPGIVYFAASGDTGGQTIYPAASPYVIAAGGTSLHSVNPVNETAWSGSGGGPSLYEYRPSYQDGILSLTGTSRGVPDFSADSDPSTGVAVYDSTPCYGLSGWMVFGGTSVASPVLAGVVNLANHVTSTTTTFSELTTIYSSSAISGTNPNFRDIVSGTAGSFSALPGWDFVTGVGSNIGLNSK